MFLADRRTDGQTDMTKLIVTFRNFPKAPNKLNPAAVAAIIIIPPKILANTSLTVTKLLTFPDP